MQTNKEELTTIEVEPQDDFQALVMNIFINEGRRREREEIIATLMEMYEVGCCCDSSSFGEHYLSEKQPDSIIKMINHRKIGL